MNIHGVELHCPQGGRVSSDCVVEGGVMLSGRREEEPLVVEGGVM